MESQLPFKQIELKNNKLFTIIIFCSTIFSIVNFTTNYYMIKTLRHFNANGEQNGILLRKSSLLFKNDVNIDGDLKTRMIDGIKFNELNIDNENSFKLKSGDSYLTLGDNMIKIQTNDFRILNQDERTGRKIDTFRLKDGELFLRNVHHLSTQKPGGLDVANSLETHTLTGSFQNDLELSSLAKSIEINSNNDLSLNSKYSQLSLDSLKDLNVNSEKIILDSKHINLKQLNKNQPTTKSTNEMYSQVCVCKNGKLFTVSGTKSCRDDNEINC